LGLGFIKYNDYTLDLTAKGAALELRDGAVLTVNGEVNASGHGSHGSGWVEGGLRVEDGSGVIDGTGTIRLASKGRLLNIGSDTARRTLTLDGVTLVGLPDNDSSLVGIGENGELILKAARFQATPAQAITGPLAAALRSTKEPSRWKAARFQTTRPREAAGWMSTREHLP
jgi:hypothetical protein